MCVCLCVSCLRFEGDAYLDPTGRVKQTTDEKREDQSERLKRGDRIHRQRWDVCLSSANLPAPAHTHGFYSL